MHTPGPWTVRHDFRSGNGELCIGVSAARIGPKSGAVAWPSGVDDAQELANARLIAAAPDLLAALQLVYSNAGAVVLTHNHPSGSPEPSRADEYLTRTLKDALTLVDVRVLDHIVVGNPATVSFAERGLL